jgi:hypothetical protein
MSIEYIGKFSCNYFDEYIFYADKTLTKEQIIIKIKNEDFYGFPLDDYDALEDMKDNDNDIEILEKKLTKWNVVIILSYG